MDGRSIRAEVAEWDGSLPLGGAGKKGGEGDGHGGSLSLHDVAVVSWALL